MALVPFGVNQKAANDHRKYFYRIAVPDLVRCGSRNVADQVLVRERPPKRRSTRFTRVPSPSLLSMLNSGEKHSRGSSHVR